MSVCLQASWNVSSGEQGSSAEIHRLRSCDVSPEGADGNSIRERPHRLIHSTIQSAGGLFVCHSADASGRWMSLKKEVSVISASFFLFFLQRFTEQERKTAASFAVLIPAELCNRTLNNPIFQ